MSEKGSGSDFDHNIPLSYPGIARVLAHIHTSLSCVLRLMFDLKQQNNAPKLLAFVGGEPLYVVNSKTIIAKITVWGA